MPNVTSERVVDYVQQEVINEQINYRPVDTQRIIPNPNLQGTGMNVCNTTVTPPTIMTPGNMFYGQSQMVQSVQPMQPNPAMVNSVQSNFNGYNPINAGLVAGMAAQPLF